MVRLDRSAGDADPHLLEGVAERYGIANAPVEEMMVPLNRAPRPSVEPVPPFGKQEEQLGLGLLEKSAARRLAAERRGVVEVRPADDQGVGVVLRPEGHVGEIGADMGGDER